MAGVPFILCENLVKIYKVANLEVVALQGLDLTVNRGEMVGLVGTSGSGKTTLMNILGGMDRPSAGRVWVDGDDLLKLSDHLLDRYRQTKVGFVWQQGSRNLVSYLDALANVSVPMRLDGLDQKETRRRSVELLEAVGLSDRQNHTLGQLSGGEQQRVAIAVALANQPALLLADEPTGEVDTATAQSIFRIFRDLNLRLELTIIIVSHDPGIARYVDRVIAIRDGKTASETIRQEPVVGSDIDEEEKYEELTVLDSVGRLQVPKEYLERYNIQGRARLDLVEEGILIRPAPRETSTTQKVDEFVVGRPQKKVFFSRWSQRIQRIFRPGGKA
ncbi:MAG: ABC transporter ATP-binding protein [Chloroflexi bacterium]|nr:ABC transporter ATP-binding protein [Chloroflexota bacterium]